MEVLEGIRSPWRALFVGAGPMEQRLADKSHDRPRRVHSIPKHLPRISAQKLYAEIFRRRRIEESWIAAPCGWTPFAGMRVTGWPIATIVRGQIVMRDDEVLGEPSGKLVNFRG